MVTFSQESVDALTRGVMAASAARDDDSRAAVSELTPVTITTLGKSVYNQGNKRKQGDRA